MQSESVTYVRFSISSRVFSSITTAYIGFLEPSTQLQEHAQLTIERTLCANPSIYALYGDELICAFPTNKEYYKPDWSEDLILSLPYVRGLFVVRTSLIPELNQSGEVYGFYDLVLKVSEQAKSIYHIPAILTQRSEDPSPLVSEKLAAVVQHALDRRGIAAHAQAGEREGTVRVRYSVRGSPLVSIIIPTKDQHEVLQKCLQSISISTTYKNIEIIIVDNGSAEPESIAALSRARTTYGARILSYPLPYNFSAINALAAAAARGEYLIFLNDDTEVLSPEWIESLLEHTQREEVGIVGCKLLFPRRTLQHAGVVIGINEQGARGIAAHWQKHIPDSSDSYFYFAHVVRNVSAVTAACMMIKKTVFEKSGGFDENLASDFNDVDLCLRLMQSGKRIIYTPYAALFHDESKNRLRWDPVRWRRIRNKEIAYIKAKWKESLMYDPYFNHNLIQKKTFLPAQLGAVVMYAKRYGIKTTARVVAHYLISRIKSDMRLFFRQLYFMAHHPSSKKRILFISFSLIDQSVQYRIRHIAEYLSVVGFACEIISVEQTPWFENRCSAYTAIVFFRVKMDARVQALITQAKRSNTYLVYASDDLIFLPEYAQYVPLPLACRKRDALTYYYQAAVNRFEVFRSCDAFLGSTEFLSRLAKNAGVYSLAIRNGLTVSQIERSERAYTCQRVRKSRPESQCVIGYVSGTKTHDRDFAISIPALERLFTKYPHILIYCVGHFDVPNSLFRFRDRIKQKAFVSWEKISNEIAQFDITIAPFDASNPFTQAKSEVKFIESSLLRIPTVATPLESYRSIIVNGENGFLASSQEEWYSSLARLVESPSSRMRIGMRAYEDVLRVYGPQAMQKETHHVFDTFVSAQKI